MPLKRRYKKCLEEEEWADLEWDWEATAFAQIVEQQQHTSEECPALSKNAQNAEAQ